MAEKFLAVFDGKNFWKKSVGCGHIDKDLHRLPIRRLATEVAVRAAGQVDRAVPGTVDVQFTVGVGNPNSVDPGIRRWARLWQGRVHYLMNQQDVICESVGHRKIHNNPKCSHCGRYFKDCPECSGNPAGSYQGEKGVDMSIALSTLTAIRSGDYWGVALFTQDWDFAPLFDELGKRQGVKVFSAFPACENETHNHSGIKGGSWIRFVKDDWVS